MISPGANELTMSPPRVSSSQPMLHIVLVEDNPGDAELVRDTLAGARDRVDITHVDSLVGARARLAERHVDVVLLDLSLPDAMGLEGVERLRLAAPEVPIVVLTGIHDEALGARALQAGAQDYLVKGESDERLLLRAMRYAIERQQVHAERARMLAQEHAARSSHYSAEEVSALAFAAAPPEIGDLSRRWRTLLDAAREIVAVLPAAEIGTCVLTAGGELFTGDAASAAQAATSGGMLFHPGRIRGALPRIVL